ncbi:MAG TPA: flagellar hook-length control protein FliK [Pseudothauera hydrothermalis]|nr:flagellar hook-length control protein FliK [Pseudothauera hydrothermalis]
MTSPLTVQPQYATAAPSGLPPFMTPQAGQGSQAGDFSQTLQNRITASRDRGAERPGDTSAARERPATDHVRKTEFSRSPDARRSSETPDRAEPAPPRDPSAKDSTTSAAPSTDGKEAQPAEHAEAGKAAADGSDVAAQPAALAATIPFPAVDAETPVAAADGQAEALQDTGPSGKPQGGAGLLPVTDDKAGKGLQNALADQPATLAEAAPGANRAITLPVQGPAGLGAKAGAVPEGPTKAVAAQQNDPASALHGILAPRSAHPLQPSAQLQVATPLGQQGWAEDVGSKLIWMSNRGESKAELVITPPNLGKIEVSINLNGDQATAQFLASTREAKEALEQAMPRLRELMAQSGVSLGQTSVNTSGDQRSGQDSATPHNPQARQSWGWTSEAGLGSIGHANGWTRQGEGLVDIFA